MKTFNKSFIFGFAKKATLFLLVFVVGISLFGCSLLAGQESFVDMTPRKIFATSQLSTEDVVENVKSAVVGISAHSNYGNSVGSGVAIEKGGYILTNHHVVAGANTILLYYADNQKGLADFVWSDPSLDLAIIKARKDMPYLECGTSKDLKVGQDIIAIGTPLTLQFKHTVTKGIVSALNRTLEVGGVQDASYLQGLVQHDASINPGNSGGPLISMDSKVVGINTLKASESEGIGFAIPIEVGKVISEKIVANSSYQPAYIGIFGFDSQIASYYNQTTANSGVFVLTIDTKSPAEIAGVMEGDIVVAVNGQETNTVLDLKMQLYKAAPGEKLTLKILRDGKQMFLEMEAKQK